MGKVMPELLRSYEIEWRALGEQSLEDDARWASAAHVDQVLG